MSGTLIKALSLISQPTECWSKCQVHFYMYSTHYLIWVVKTIAQIYFKHHCMVQLFFIKHRACYFRIVILCKLIQLNNWYCNYRMWFNEKYHQLIVSNTNNDGEHYRYCQLVHCKMTKLFWRYDIIILEKVSNLTFAKIDIHGWKALNRYLFYFDFKILLILKLENIFSSDL